MAKHIKFSLAKQEQKAIAPARTDITVGQLAAGLALRFPAEDAESWDHNGLSVGDANADVTKVALALDPTPDAVEAAASLGANVLLTHHPVCMEPTDTFVVQPMAKNMAGNTVFAAVQHGVALINVHTPLDVSPRAASVLPNLLRLVPQDVLQEIPSSTPRAKKGYGQVCTFEKDDIPVTLAQLAARCTSVFGRAPRVWGQFSRKLETVATWTGSIGSCIGDAEVARIDCLICGEVKYHAALALVNAGLSIIELGHDVSELPMLVPLAMAASECGIAQEDLVTIDQTRNWALPEAMRV